MHHQAAGKCVAATRIDEAEYSGRRGHEKDDEQLSTDKNTGEGARVRGGVPDKEGVPRGCHVRCYLSGQKRLEWLWKVRETTGNRRK